MSSLPSEPRPVRDTPPIPATADDTTEPMLVTEAGALSHGTSDLAAYSALVADEAADSALVADEIPDHPAFLEAILWSREVEASDLAWRGDFRGKPYIPRFYRRWRPEPTMAYIICHTPRSGSTWLASMLRQTKRMGRPGEYFNFPWRYQPGAAAGYMDYVRRIRLRTATRNGVFGMKASLNQAAPFIRAGLFAQPEEVRVIYLTREDTLQQAISQYRAITTDVWAGRPGRTGEVPFDREAIWTWLGWLLEMMKGWEAVFGAYRILPLRITYEQLRGDPIGAAIQVARYVGVDLTADAFKRAQPVREETARVDEEWVRRMRVGYGQREAGE